MRMRAKDPNTDGWLYGEADIHEGLSPDKYRPFTTCYAFPISPTVEVFDYDLLLLPELHKTFLVARLKNGSAVLMDRSGKTYCISDLCDNDAHKPTVFVITNIIDNPEAINGWLVNPDVTLIPIR